MTKNLFAVVLLWVAILAAMVLSMYITKSAWCLLMLLFLPSYKQISE